MQVQQVSQGLFQMRRKLSAKAKCPCGSGKIYKHCCFTKSFDWTIDEQGEIYRQVPLSHKMIHLLKGQAREFKQIFERDPSADDRVFLTQYILPQEEFDEVMEEVMHAVKVDPARIYAWKKTGRLITEANLDLLPDNELSKWGDAIKEDRRIKAKKKKLKRTPEERCFEKLSTEFFRI